MIYIAVLGNSTESLQNRSTILPLFIGPYEQGPNFTRIRVHNAYTVYENALLFSLEY